MTTTTPMTTKKYLQVELYQITDKEVLKRLDALEGHPQWYIRTPIQTLSGKDVQVYNMPEQEFGNRIFDPVEETFLTYEEGDNKFYSWER